MKAILKNIRNYLNKKKYRNRQVLFHNNSKVDKNSIFHGYNAIGVNTILNNCNLGFGSYVGRNNELTSVFIGNFCSLGSFIINTTGRHPSSIFVSTHPVFFSKGKAAGFRFLYKSKFTEMQHVDNNYLVKIGNDVWIGDRVTILDGIIIGDGAIIGAGSVVTKNVEPYTINVGIPAKPINSRFTAEQIEFLLRFKWWEKDKEWIKQNADLFEDIELFMKKYNEN